MSVSGFGVGGDESKCVENETVPHSVELMRSVRLPGSCTFRSGAGVVTAACRELRMSEASSLVYVDTWDLKV